VLILVGTGLVNVNMLNQFQRQIIVLIFIAAAVLTPGPDIASQLMLAFPLLALYELSVLLAYAFDRFRSKQKAVAR
jgi:sec-independent protein translocase protein TatC